MYIYIYFFFQFDLAAIAQAWQRTRKQSWPWKGERGQCFLAQGCPQLSSTTWWPASASVLWWIWLQVRGLCCRHAWICGSRLWPFAFPTPTAHNILFAKIRGPLPHFAPPRGEQVPPQKRRMERRGGPEERRETLTNPKGKNWKRRKAMTKRKLQRRKKGKTASRKVHHRRTTKKTRRRKRKNKRRKAALLATRSRGEIADRLEPRDFQSVGVDPRREGTCWSQFCRQKWLTVIGWNLQSVRTGWFDCLQ